MGKIIALCLLLFNTTIKGRITDARNGDPVVGAVVTIKGTHLTTQTGLDGSYEFKNIPDGAYTVEIAATSYESYSGAPGDIQLQPAERRLKDVVVTGRSSGATDAGARQLEKASDNVLNILSTHQIQLMPDVTVANVLRRVSGVTVDRGEDGEGRYPVIRGMDKRYNYTLVNGIKIPSPDDKNRYVPMDIFPSEMLQRLEVIKSLTPDMEGDAIGGVMNMVMKDPPAKLTVSSQGALGYSQMVLDNPFNTYPHGAVNHQSPNEIHGISYAPPYTGFTTNNLYFSQKHPLPDGQLGLTLGNRYLHDRLGVVLSGSYQSANRFTKDHYFSMSPQPTPLMDNSEPLMTDEQYRTYSTNETRFGAHAKLDYRLGQRSRISFYTVFIGLNSYQSRFITDTGNTSSLGTGSGSRDVTYNYRSRTDLQSIYNATLQGQHALGQRFTFDWSAVYSKATQKMPDRAELSLAQTFADSAGQLRPYDKTSNQYNLPPLVSSLEHIWQHNSDQDVSGYLNAHYKVGQFDIGVGGMGRHKNRDNYFIEYDWSPAGNDEHYTGDLSQVAMLLKKASVQDDNDYKATEDIEAGYAELRWKNERWNILGGVRVENTHQTYNQYALPAGQASNTTGSQQYIDVLPSIQFKYKLDDKSALHLAYFSSISRPGFFEIVPFEFPGEYFTETGNPNLLHTKANNIDLRYELFPGKEGQLLLGVFYKHLVDPIEMVYNRPATSLSTIEPQNVGKADNIGGEVVYTHYWKKIGVSANYTYTYSRVSTPYKYYYAIPGKDTATLINKTRPLQGQAAHIGNVSLLYRAPKAGLELQLAAIYTGRHIVYLSQYATPGSSMDYWQRGTTVLDFSGEKKIGNHFSVYVKLNNLLNTPDIVEMDFPPTTAIKQQFPDASNRGDRTLVEKKTFGQTYLAGIRYHL